MTLGTTLLRYSSPIVYVEIAFLAIFLPLGPRVVRRVWSGEHSYVKKHDPPRAWPWGAPLWRGYTRSLVVCWIAMPLMILAVVVARVAPRHSSSPLFWVAAVLLISAAVVILVVFPSVVLFAWPKPLIPPVLRRQPGAVAEWWGQLRGPRRGRRATLRR